MVDQLYTELSGSAALAYAEVLDNALSRHIETGEGLTFTSQKRPGSSGTYWYLQHSLPKPKKRYYLGAETPELLARIEQQKERWAAGKVEASMLERQVAMAIGAGCTPVTYQAYRVLNAAGQSGLFRAGGVLVGSYAFLALGNMLGVSWRADTTITQDMDFAASKQCMVAIPGGGKPLKDTIMATDSDFLEVPMLDARTPSTSFVVRGKDFRVDVVTPKVGKGESPVYVPSIKSYADSVRFLDFVLEDTQKAVMLAKAGVVVNVPNPARFALHKLVVSQRRHQGQRAKTLKDIKQAEQVIAVLLDQRPGDLWLGLDAAVAFHDKFARELKQSIGALADKKMSEALLTQLKAAGGP